MVASVVTVAFEGVDARRVDVQVQQLSSDQPSFTIVGLADKAVAESRERVRGAFAGIGLALPSKRIIANLAPADLPKEGSHFDLPIALALLASMGVIPPDALNGWAAIGELGLDGQIAPVGGALPAAVAADAMGLGLICPEFNGPEAAWAGDVAVLAPRSLIGLVNHFKGVQVLRRPERQVPLVRLARQPTTDVVALDRVDATAVGRLLAATGTRDVVDAPVVVCARRAGQRVVTSDPDDLARLDPGLSVLTV